MNIRRCAHSTWSWVCIFLSLNGLQSLTSALLGLVVSLHLYQEFQSPAFMANALFCFMAPKIYLSFGAGVVVDRLGARLILRIALFGILGVSVIAFFFIGGRKGIPSADFVYCLNGVLGALAAFYDSALMVFVPLFVSEDRYTRVYSWMEFFSNSSLLLAPVLGPVVFMIVPLGNLFCLQGFSALLILFWVSSMGGLTSTSFPKNRKILPSLELFPWIWKHPVLGSLLRYFCLNNLLNGLGAGLITAYVLERTGGDVRSVSALGVGAAVATFLGSSLNFLISRWQPLWLIFWSGLGAAVCGRVFFGASTSLWLLILWASLRVGVVPMMNTANQVLWTEKTETDSRGRVFGVRRLVAQGFYPVAILLGGGLYSGLQEIFSYQLGPFFILLGGCESLLSLWFLSKVFSLREASNSQKGSK